ncbi:hypothetical protein [Sphingomonas sp. MS122]|uniref:hypothetical protein n=1 Tax=Sphingomonas sp. MS122 TaxID=3412683 RepID=UPI003C2E16DF
MSIGPINSAVRTVGATLTGLLPTRQPERAPPPPPPNPEPAGPSPGGGTGVKFELGIVPQPGTTGPAVTIGAGRETQHGNVTYTASVRVGQGTTVGAEGKQASGEATVSAGSVANFEIIAPEGTSAEQLAGINPFDPRSLPPGVQVKVDLGQFVGTQYEAQVRHVLATQSVRLESGVTMQVQRSADGNQAQVSVGPYQAVERASGMGLDAGPVTAQLARVDQLRTNSLFQQKLDISGPETRVLDTQNVTTHEYVSSTGIQIGVGPISAELGMRENSGVQTITRNADGSMTVSDTFYYDNAVPVTINRSFNADGTERVTDRTYSYTVKVTEDNRQLLHAAFGGSARTAVEDGLKPGTTLVLTYNQCQMGAMQAQFDRAEETFGRDPWGTQGFRVAGTDPALSFAVALSRNGASTRNDYAFGEMLFEVADAADGNLEAGGEFVANPGTAYIIETGRPPQVYRPE